MITLALVVEERSWRLPGSPVLNFTPFITELSYRTLY